MKKYKNIKSKANRIGNNSLATLGVRIVDTVNNSAIREAKEARLFRNLVEVSNRYQQTAEPGKAKELRESIDDLFNRRYTTFMDLYDYVAGQTKSPVETTRQAALLVFAQLNKYGKAFLKLKIADQSLAYMRIIEGLKSADLADAEAELSMTDKVTEFDNLQRTYEDLYMGRGNSNSVAVRSSTIRRDMLGAIGNYADELKVMAVTNNSEEWDTLYANVAQRFDEVYVAYNRRKKSKKSDDEKTEEEVAA